jgi:tRNA nucleotidyltransferase (CCA-adding enzyme)
VAHDDLSEAAPGGAPPPKGRSGQTNPEFEQKHARTSKGRTGGGEFAKKQGAGQQAGQRRQGPKQQSVSVATALKAAGVKSLSEFQKTRGLPVTGRLDTRTMVALRNAYVAHLVDLQSGGGTAKVTTARGAGVVQLGPNEYAKRGMGTKAEPDARVARVQQTLERLGYDVPIDGVFTPELEKAVKQFQEDNGLTSSGVVDVNTLRKMDKLHSARDASGKQPGLTADQPVGTRRGGRDELQALARKRARSVAARQKAAKATTSKRGKTSTTKPPTSATKPQTPPPTTAVKITQAAVEEDGRLDRIVFAGKPVKPVDVTTLPWWHGDDAWAVEAAIDWRAILHPRDRIGRFRHVLGGHKPIVRKSTATATSGVYRSAGARRSRHEVPEVGEWGRELVVRAEKLTEQGGPEDMVESALHLATLHQWPDMTPISFGIEPLEAGTDGELRLSPPRRGSTERWHVVVGTSALAKKQGQSALAHEMGHTLDAAMMYPGHDADRDPRKPELMQHYFASRLAALAEHRQIAEAGLPMTPEQHTAWREFLRTSMTGSVLRQRKNISYWRSPEEMWARAYTQWAATAEGRGGGIGSSLDPFLQWPAEEWEPVGRAVEGVLASYGLLHTDLAHKWGVEPGGIEPVKFRDDVQKVVDEVNGNVAIFGGLWQSLEISGFKFVRTTGGLDRWEKQMPGGVLRAELKAGTDDVRFSFWADTIAAPEKPKVPLSKHALPGYVKKQGEDIQFEVNDGVVSPREALMAMGFKPDEPGEDHHTYAKQFREGTLRARHKPGQRRIEWLWEGKATSGVMIHEAADGSLPRWRTLRMDKVRVGQQEIVGPDVTTLSWWSGPVQEAKFERLHPRDRKGRFRRKFGPVRTVAKVRQVSVSLDHAPASGLPRTREAEPELFPASTAAMIRDAVWIDRDIRDEVPPSEWVVLAQNAVATAHRWPITPPMEFQIGELDDAATGSFFVNPPSWLDESWEVSLDENAMHNQGATTYVHEMGHTLDAAMAYEFNAADRAMLPQNRGFFASGLAASDDPRARAVLGEERFQAWRRFLHEAVTQSVVDDQILPPSYFRSPHELWARAYCQWIATTDEENLLYEMQLENVDGWPAEEWEPVGRAVEGVLAAYGLLHEGDHAWEAERRPEKGRAPLRQPLNASRPMSPETMTAMLKMAGEMNGDAGLAATAAVMRDNGFAPVEGVSHDVAERLRLLDDPRYEVYWRDVPGEGQAFVRFAGEETPTQVQFAWRGEPWTDPLTYVVEATVGRATERLYGGVGRRMRQHGGFVEGRHPRDRMGRWRDVPGVGIGAKSVSRMDVVDMRELEKPVSNTPIPGLGNSGGETDLETHARELFWRLAAMTPEERDAFADAGGGVMAPVHDDVAAVKDVVHGRKPAVLVLGSRKTWKKVMKAAFDELGDTWRGEPVPEEIADVYAVGHAREHGFAYDEDVELEAMTFGLPDAVNLIHEGEYLPPNSAWRHVQVGVGLGYSDADIARFVNRKVTGDFGRALEIAARERKRFPPGRWPLVVQEAFEGAQHPRDRRGRFRDVFGQGRMVAPHTIEKALELRSQPGEGKTMTRHAKPTGEPGIGTLLDRAAKARGMIAAHELERAIEWRLHDVVGPASGSVPLMRVRPESLAFAIRTGHFPNWHEQPSADSHRGSGYGKSRAKHEREWFGMSPKTPAEWFPHYGYMGRPDEENVALNPVGGFGEIRLVLNRDVRQRTTFTYSDSLYVGSGEKSVVPSPVDAPRAYSVGGTHAFSILDVEHPTLPKNAQERPQPPLTRKEQAELEDWKRHGRYVMDYETGREERKYGDDLVPEFMRKRGDRLMDEGVWWPWTHGDFFEAQIHGGVDWTDVERIDFPEEPSQSVQIALAERGIAWSVYPRDKVQEAAYEEGLHPRNRLGRWVRKLGYPSYMVGGTVRDSLMGRDPKDVDFVVMAHPDKVKRAVEAAGARVEDLTVRDRLVGVRVFPPSGVDDHPVPREGIEIAPPRVEVSTGASRHDFVIEPHPALTSQVPDDQRAYIAEGAMVRGGVVGRKHTIPLGRMEDGSALGSYGPVPRALSAWASEIAGKPVRIVGSNYFREEGDHVHATANRVTNSITVRPDTDDLTILHELAHLMAGEGGHGEEWQRIAHGLYRDHIGPEAANTFAQIMWPDVSGVAIPDDAKRRDFTINALYQDVDTGEVIDPTGTGRADLDARVLRTTSSDSFTEDPLRMLRATRFMSSHGFQLHPDTREQMVAQADSIDALTQGGVSGTAQVELNKTLMGRHVGDALRAMRDTGTLAAFLPELRPAIGFDQESAYHDLPLDDHIISVVENLAKVDAPLEVRLAALFHDAGKPEAAFRGADGHLHFYGSQEHGKEDHALVSARIARRALERLNYPADVIDRVERLIEHHMVEASGSRRAARARQWRAAVGTDLVDDLLMHRRADITAKGEAEPAHVEGLERFTELVKSQAGAPAVRGDLAVKGSDLLSAGVPTGPMMGDILADLLKHVIADPSLNRQDWLLARAAKLAKLREALSEAGYRPDLHPRDRLGRWRDKGGWDAGVFFHVTARHQDVEREGAVLPRGEQAEPKGQHKFPVDPDAVYLWPSAEKAEEHIGYVERRFPERKGQHAIVPVHADVAQLEPDPEPFLNLWRLARSELRRGGPVPKGWSEHGAAALDEARHYPDPVNHPEGETLRQYLLRLDVWPHEVSSPHEQEPEELRADPWLEARRLLKDMPVALRRDVARAFSQEGVAVLSRGRGVLAQSRKKPELTPGEAGLVNHLRMMTTMRASSFRKGQRAYHGYEDFVLRHGKLFQHGPSESEVEYEFHAKTRKECFRNALLAAISHPELTYVEGYAYTGLIPVHHAWLVDQHGRVHDPTWEGLEGERVYLGVPFSTEYLSKTVLKKRTDTLFDDFGEGVPLDGPPSADMLRDVPGRSVPEELQGPDEGALATLGEAEFDERLHPRGRTGRWVGKLTFSARGDAVGPEYHETITALLDDKPVGHVSVSHYEGEVHIQHIEVDPEHRRKGIGMAMIGRLKQDSPDAPIYTLGDVATEEGEAFRRARLERFPNSEPKPSLYGASPERVAEFADALQRADQITRADVEAGRWPGLHMGPLPEGIAGRAGLAEGLITLTPSSFKADGTIDSVHLAHEVGHYLNLAVLKDGKVPPELEAMESGAGRAAGHYGHVGHSRLFGEHRELPEEFIAHSYADVIHGDAEFRYIPGIHGPDDPEEREKYRAEWEATAKTKWLQFLARLAEQHGLPGRGLWKFEPTGTGEYRMVPRVQEAHFDPTLHPRGRGGRWRKRLGLKRLELKPEGGKRRLSDKSVLAKVQRVVDAFGDFYGDADKITAYHEPEYLGSVGSDARFRHEGEVLAGLLYGSRAHEGMSHPDYGVEWWRVMAHEAAHGISGTRPGPLPGFSQTIEEGAAEILSLWFWKHRGQEFDRRDAARVEGRWTKPGLESLTHHVAYREWTAEVLRRAASKVGWNRDDLIDEVERVMRGDHNVRLKWRDTTTEADPPDGVGPDAVSLIGWLLSDTEVAESETQERAWRVLDRVLSAR